MKLHAQFSLSERKTIGVVYVHRVRIERIDIRSSRTLDQIHVVKIRLLDGLNVRTFHSTGYTDHRTILLSQIVYVRTRVRRVVEFHKRFLEIQLEQVRRSVDIHIEQTHNLSVSELAVIVRTVGVVIAQTRAILSSGICKVCSLCN